MHSSSWHRKREEVAVIGPPYGAMHAEAQMYSSRIDAAEGSPIPYLGNMVLGRVFCLGESLV